MFYFTFGGVAPIAMQVLQVINKETLHIAEYFRSYFCLVPIYNLNYGYISILNRFIVEALNKKEINSIKALDWECAG